MTGSEGVGDRFQEASKYRRETLSGGNLDWRSKPEVYKEYSGCKRIDLPAYEHLKTASLISTLKQRKSIRHFTGEPLSLEHLSFLLWASSGIQRVEMGHEFRTAPSAGALYPVETYLAVENIDSLPKGIYHYAVKGHRLEPLRLGNIGYEITQAALDQKMCLGAPVVFIWTAIFFRSKWKYEERAYRYIYLDAGHIAENLALAATSVGLGTCQIGALFDDEANAVVGVDGKDESVIYMTVVGHPA